MGCVFVLAPPTLVDEAGPLRINLSANNYNASCAYSLDSPAPYAQKYLRDKIYLFFKKPPIGKQLVFEKFKTNNVYLFIGTFTFFLSLLALKGFSFFINNNCVLLS